MEKVIIFDFDGVLSDSFETLYEINRLGAEHVGRQLSPEEYRSCYRGNIHQELKKFLDLDEEQNTTFREFKKGIIDTRYNSETVKLFSYAASVVPLLAEQADLYIVSAIPTSVIENMLGKANLTKCFKKISSNNREGKRAEFESILSNYPEEAQTFFVTDTVGDILEAQDLPVVTIGVSWGFQNPGLLAAAGATFIAHSPEELSRYVTNS